MQSKQISICFTVWTNLTLLKIFLYYLVTELTNFTFNRTKTQYTINLLLMLIKRMLIKKNRFYLNH